MKSKLLFTLLFSLINFYSFSQNLGDGNDPSCGGTIYDSGGASGDYLNNDTITQTYCSNAGNCINVTFSSFSVESGYDELSIYDGSDIFSPLLGSYAGTALPNNGDSIVATQGCITFQFTSDGSTTFLGWEAVLSCVCPPDIFFDDCGLPDTLTVESTCNSVAYDFTGMTWSGVTTSSCSPIASPIDAWYTFTATSDSTTFEATTNGSNSFYLAVFSGSCGSLTELGCQSPTPNGPVDLTVSTTSGTDYLVQIVSSTGVSAGNICAYEAVVANVDCNIAKPICGNTSFNDISSGDGIEEIDGTAAQGCLASGERQSSWYTFTILTGGSLEFTISATSGTDDYDFALWGPDGTCPPTNTPLRCSYAQQTGSTGLQSGAGDDSEGSNPAISPRYVNDITVTAGQTYVLLVDNHSASNSPFDLDWGGTAVLDCSVLPIELTNFTVKNENNFNLVSWSTLTEINNSHFELERSVDAINWILIENIPGNGNSNQQNNYTFKDHNYKQAINYYRLKQIDFDGKVSTFKTLAINNSLSNSKTLVSISNLLGKTVTEKEPGIKFYRYSDGSVVKKIDL